jgi:hypothetical protein
MNYTDYSHRYGEIILNSAYAVKKEIESVIKSISTPDIEAHYVESNEKKKNAGKNESKGKQASLNSLFRSEFAKVGWDPEKKVFDDDDNDLKMDFWKKDFGIDVAFNHRSFIGGDLLRLQAAAEVKDLIKVGIYICATKEFAKYLSPKDASSMVSFERAKWYLESFYPVITTPIYLVGLSK